MRLSFAAVILALLLPMHAAGQQYSTSGFNLGISLNGTSTEVDDPDIGGETETGGGLSLQLGYNFSPSLGLFLKASGAVMEADEADEYQLGHGDLGGRYLFLDEMSKFRPYLQLALTGFSAQADYGEIDIELNGAGITGGAGFHYFFSPRWAIDLVGQYTTGSIDEVVIDGSKFSDGTELDISTFRFDLGAAWYP